jgi:hypothetical protein
MKHLLSVGAAASAGLAITQTATAAQSAPDACADIIRLGGAVFAPELTGMCGALVENLPLPQQIAFFWKIAGPQGVWQFLIHGGGEPWFALIGLGALAALIIWAGRRMGWSEERKRPYEQRPLFFTFDRILIVTTTVVIAVLGYVVVAAALTRG